MKTLDRLPSTQAKILFALVTVGLALWGANSVIASNFASPTIPPAKQAYLDQDAQRRADAASRNASQGVTKSKAQPPAAAPAESPLALDPQQRAGDGVLIQSSVPPAGEINTTVKNRWYLSLSDGGSLVIYAGCNSKVHSEGVVLVARQPTSPVARYIAPGAHGCLTITNAAGRILTLVAADRHVLRFDAATMQFQ